MPNITDIEKVYALMKSRFNIERDELDALGIDTEEKVREYFHSQLKTLGTLDVSDEDDQSPEPEDSFKLPAGKLRQVKHRSVKEAELARRKHAEEFASHAVPGAGVSLEEAQREQALMLEAIGEKPRFSVTKARKK